jgi:hypothetical protein
MTMEESERNPSASGREPDRAGVGPALGEKAKGDAERLKQQAKERAADLGKSAKRQADAALDRGGRAAGEFADAIDAAAAELSDEDREGLARYTKQLSSSMQRIAEQLQNKNVDELAADVRRLARNNPNAYLLGSVALGFGLSRFFKATSRPRPEQRHEAHTAEDPQLADRLRTPGTPGSTTLPGQGVIP